MNSRMDILDMKIAQIRSKHCERMPWPPACRVTNRIWLGSKYDVTDPVWMRSNKITHVLNCATPVDRFDPSSVTEYACLNADDDPGYPILDLHFATTKEFMDRALQRPDSQILVHCMAGINRSATLVLAYVSQRDTTSTLQKVERFARYFDIVMLQRPIILMNEGFYEQLIDWVHDRPVRPRTNQTFFTISNIL